LVDEPQDWIEKYRAALDQQPLRGTARLSAAFQWVTKGFAFALGKTFGKPVGASENSAATRRSPEREMKGHPRPDAHANQQSSGEKSSRLKPRDKKAS
jgi:hypothetical protein